MEMLNDLLQQHIGLNLKNCDNGKGVYLQGPIKVEKEWIYVKMLFPTYPSLKNVEIQIQSQRLPRTLLRKKYNNLNEQQSIHQVIDNIPILLQQNNCLPSNPWESVAYKGNIFNDITTLFSPKDYEINLNANYSQISFTKFAQHEQHFVEFELPSLKIIKHSLPSCVEWNNMLGKPTSLINMIKQFISYLDEMQLFYENIAVIDELCHVVEPVEPSTKENYRMFSLKERVFLKVIFMDPFAPLASMSVSIIGATEEVMHLRRIYSDGLCNWDSELDVHKNLLRIFDLCFFPMPPTASTPLQFCNICYAYKVQEGEVPIVSCDNPHCNLIYHAACLGEWFNTLIDGRVFLNVSLGVCPFCKAKLSTSFQELLSSKLII